MTDYSILFINTPLCNSVLNPCMKKHIWYVHVLQGNTIANIMQWNNHRMPGSVPLLIWHRPPYEIYIAGMANLKAGADIADKCIFPSQTI